MKKNKGGFIDGCFSPGAVYKRMEDGQWYKVQNNAEVTVSVCSCSSCGRRSQNLGSRDSPAIIRTHALLMENKWSKIEINTRLCQYQENSSTEWRDLSFVRQREAEELPGIEHSWKMISVKLNYSAECERRDACTRDQFFCNIFKISLGKRRWSWIFTVREKIPPVLKKKGTLTQKTSRGTDWRMSCCGQSWACTNTHTFIHQFDHYCEEQAWGTTWIVVKSSRKVAKHVGKYVIKC